MGVGHSCDKLYLDSIKEKKKFATTHDFDVIAEAAMPRVRLRTPGLRGHVDNSSNHQ